MEFMDRLSQKSTSVKVNEWLQNSNDVATSNLSSGDAAKNVKQNESNNSRKIEKPSCSTSVNAESSMVSLLQTQMQLMCRSYLEDLPVFDGDIEFWPIFYAQFKSTTEQGNLMTPTICVASGNHLKERV